MEEEKTTALSKIEEQAGNLPTVNWKDKEGIALVKSIVAKDCTETEFKYLYYVADKYDLDPLRKEIWAVKFSGKPALVFVGRDGLLSIAWKLKDKHGDPVFGSMETTFELEKPDPNSKIKYISNIVKPISATCTIFRRDYDKPFRSTVFFDEYDRKMALWKDKPKVMLGKCAESTCLKRAFNISGLLIPEEMPYPNEGVQNGTKTM